MPKRRLFHLPILPAVFLAALATGSPVAAQSWEVVAGVDGVDQAHAIAMAADGGSAIAASSYSWNPGASQCGAIARFSPAGQLLWARCVSEAGRDYDAADIARLADGRWAVVGTSWPTDRASASDGWVALFSDAGAMQWTRTFYTAGRSASFSSVAVAPSGQIYAAGSLAPVSPLPAAGQGMVDFDAFVVALRNDGVEAWRQTYTADWSISFLGNTTLAMGWSEGVEAMAVAADGRILLTGSAVELANLYTPTQVASTWAFAAQLAADGTPMWGKRIGTGNAYGETHRYRAAAATVDGGWVVGGDQRSISTGVMTRPLIAKLGRDGATAWQGLLGDSGANVFADSGSITGLAAQANGGILASLEHLVFIYDFVIPSAADGALARLDAAGNVLATRTFNEPGSPTPSGWVAVNDVASDGSRVLFAGTNNIARVHGHDLWLGRVPANADLGRSRHCPRSPGDYEGTLARNGLVSFTFQPFSLTRRDRGIAGAAYAHAGNLSLFFKAGCSTP